MTNLIEQAINCNDGDLAAKIIRDALGIQSDDVANYCFPKEWPASREQRASSRTSLRFATVAQLERLSPRTRPTLRASDRGRATGEGELTLLHDGPPWTSRNLTR